MGPKRLVLYNSDNIHGMKAAMHVSKVFSTEAASFRSIGRNKRRKSKRKEQTPPLESVPSSRLVNRDLLSLPRQMPHFRKAQKFDAVRISLGLTALLLQISIKAFAADIAVHHIKNIRQLLHIEP